MTNHLADAAHHESRHIKGKLAESKERIAEAKARRWPREAMTQEWHAPSTQINLSEDTLGVGSSQFEEMKEKLLEFERDLPLSSLVSSREKGFFAALRSLLLEISTSRSPKEAGTRIVAAHKWYVKHRPR